MTTTNAIDDEPYIDADEVARLFGVSVAHVRRMSREGKLPYYDLSPRCRRYKRSEVEKWAGDKRREVLPFNKRNGQG